MKFNHMDNFSNSFKASEFLKKDFLAYKVIYETKEKVVEVCCFNKIQLKNEVLTLFKQFRGKKQIINVVGITGGKNGRKYPLSV